MNFGFKIIFHVLYLKIYFKGKTTERKHPPPSTHTLSFLCWLTSPGHVTARSLVPHPGLPHVWVAGTRPPDRQLDPQQSHNSTWNTTIKCEHSKPWLTRLGCSSHRSRSLLKCLRGDFRLLLFELCLQHFSSVPINVLACRILQLSTPYLVWVQLFLLLLLLLIFIVLEMQKEQQPGLGQMRPRGQTQSDSRSRQGPDCLSHLQLLPRLP